MGIFEIVKHYLNTTKYDSKTPYLVVLADERYYIHYFKDEVSWKEYRGSFDVMDVEYENAEWATFLNFGKEFHPHIEFKWVDEIDLKYLRRKEIHDCIMEALESNEETNAKLIRQDLKEDKFKVITFNEGKTIDGILICAVSSDEDYYYMSINMNKKVHYSSCVGKYQIVDDEDVINEYNIWLKENRTEIQEIIDKEVYDNFDVPFTDCII